VLACAQAGIACSVIPGLSSATAAPTLAGIPVTHRGLTQSFTVISGHLPPATPTAPSTGQPWPASKASGHTVSTVAFAPLRSAPVR
jgi:siroheme synthase